MAKSEIPSIVVHSGGGASDSSSSNGVGGAPASLCPSPAPTEGTPRVGRLAKQEEVDLEEPSSVPVTICVGCDEETTTAECKEEENEEGGAPSFTSPPPVPPHAPAGRGSSQGQAKTVSGKHGGRLCKQGGSSPQGSLEGSSPSLSRDSSTETYTDSTGIDLEQFIVETLHKNHKDRAMMLRIEQDLINLIKDAKRPSHKFQQMSSYHRMLVHRVAAYFGLDHNVDQNGTSVIVNKTRSTRLPDVRFKDQIREDLLQEEPKKSILKRDSASFEDGKEKSPERQSSTDSRRSKSIEQREEEYEKARARIFNQDEGVGESSLSRSSQEDLGWSTELRPWSSTDSDSSGRRGPLLVGLDPEGCDTSRGKMYSLLTKGGDPAEGPRLGKMLAGVTKASSFGGVSVLHRDSSLNEARTAAFRTAKAESFNVSSLPTVVQGACPQSPQQQQEPPSTCSTASSTPATTPATCAPPSSAAVGQQPTSWTPSGRDSVSSRPDSTPMQQQHYSAAGGTTLWPPAVDPSVPPPGSILFNPQTGTPLLSSETPRGPYRRVANSPLTGHPPALVLGTLHPGGGYVAPPARAPQALVYVPFMQPPHNEGMVRDPDMDCGGVMGEVGPQLSSLSLVPSSDPPPVQQPQHLQSQQPPPGELGTAGYLVRGFVAPHQVPTSMQGPVYYVQQAVPTSCAASLRGYMCPSVAAPPPMTEMPAFLPQGGQPPLAGCNPVAGPMVASGYHVHGYYQQPTSGAGHQVALPQRGCAVDAAPVYVTYAVAPSPGEPAAQYPGGVLVGNPAGGAQVVPMYLVPHGTPAGQHPGVPQTIGGPTQGSGTPPAPPPQFSLRYLPVRPQTPPSGGAAPPQPLLGYTLYSAGPPPAGNLAQGSMSAPPPQPMGASPPQFAPVVTAFQVLRPNVSLVGANEGSSPVAQGVAAPPLVLSSQFSTPPPSAPPTQGGVGPQLAKPVPHSQANQPQPMTLTFGKPVGGGAGDTFSGVCATHQPRYTTCQTLSHRRHVGHYTAAELYQAVIPATEESQAGNQSPQSSRIRQVTAPTLPSPTVFRRALPLLPDVRLLGHPLQQQLRQLVPPPTRPRFPMMGAPATSMPPPSQCPGARPPKTGGRKQRNPRAASRTPSASGDAPVQHATTASQPTNDTGPPPSNILEVEGLNETLKPHEVERILEPLVSATGARLHFTSGCAQVLAVFDSATAAQGALVAAPNIPNVRLRPLSSTPSLLPHHPPS